MLMLMSYQVITVKKYFCKKKLQYIILEAFL